jgi:hypothetical protein
MRTSSMWMLQAINGSVACSGWLLARRDLDLHQGRPDPLLALCAKYVSPIA